MLFFVGHDERLHRDQRSLREAEEFGGAVRELEIIAAYIKALAVLGKRITDHPPEYEETH